MAKTIKFKDGVPGIAVSNLQTSSNSLRQRSNQICPVCHKIYIPFSLNGAIVCSSCKRGTSGCCGR